jgi:hypothetical protein
MGAPTPQFIPEAFAISAAAGDRNTIPAAPVSTQRASFDLGFPPLTMTPVVAGGKPMLGPDMNGILYMISTHTVYAQSGALYQYNADVVVAIGGYAVGTLLSSSDGLTVWYNLTNGNTDDPNDSASLGWVPLYSYGATAITGLIGGVRVLTPQEAAKSVIVLFGALIGNQQIVLPAHVQSWLIVNTCSGAFNVTVKTAAGTGVVVPAGSFASPTGVYCNAVDINLTYSPAALPIDVSATADTIPKRDNLGYLYASTIAGSTDSTTRVATTAFVQAVGNNAIATATAAALAAMLGSAAQSWQGISLSNGGLNTNSTGRPILVRVVASINGVPGGAVNVTVNGANLGGIAASGGGSVQMADTFIVPAGDTYVVAWSGSLNSISVTGLM